MQYDLANPMIPVSAVIEITRCIPGLVCVTDYQSSGKPYEQISASVVQAPVGVDETTGGTGLVNV